MSAPSSTDMNMSVEPTQAAPPPPLEPPPLGTLPLGQLPLGQLSLGSVAIGFPVVQAALSGYSDWPMRLIARQHGASYAICEVLLDEFLLALKARKSHQQYLRLSPEDHPVGGQLMGAEPIQFAEGAKRLVAAGFDVIDINFGCPVKKVLGRCRGGFHLSQPAVAIEIVRRTREAVPPGIPVTVKMRRGLDDSSASRDNFFTILDAAFEAGVAAVTVHGRTVEQRYIGASRWEFLAEVKRHVGARTILGSGDLFSAPDCLRMMAETGVDGVTVARGAIGNPWIFTQARALADGAPLPPPPSLHQQRDTLREHFRLAELHNPSRCGIEMRKFGIKYAALHPRYAEVRAAMVSVRNRDDWERVLRAWYEEDAPGCFPDRARHDGVEE